MFVTICLRGTKQNKQERQQTKLKEMWDTVAQSLFDFIIFRKFKCFSCEVVTKLCSTVCISCPVSVLRIQTQSSYFLR